jgi:hypothetical protein
MPSGCAGACFWVDKEAVQSLHDASIPKTGPECLEAAATELQVQRAIGEAPLHTLLTPVPISLPGAHVMHLVEEQYSLADRARLASSARDGLHHRR